MKLNLFKISEGISEMPILQQKYSYGGWWGTIETVTITKSAPPSFSFDSMFSSYPDNSSVGGGGGGETSNPDQPGENINDPNGVVGKTETTIKEQIAGLKMAIQSNLVSGKDLEDIQKVIDSYQKTLDTLDLMKNSDNKYRFDLKPGYDNDPKNTAQLSYDSKTGEFVITIENTTDIGLLAHELEHVNQLENGEITLGKDGMLEGVDIYDEVDAYDIQHKITYGIYYDQIDLTGDPIKDSTIDYKITPEEIWKEYPGMYDDLKPSQGGGGNNGGNNVPSNESSSTSSGSYRR